MFYQDLESLFRNILQHEQILVYGDLGRLPHIVVQYLSSNYAHLKVMFASIYYPIQFANHLQFRHIDYGDISQVKCDLLVLVEPSAYSVIRDKYPGASCVLVLTSHAILEFSNPNVRHAIYFHAAGGGGPDTFDWSTRVHRIRKLMSKMEGSEECDDIQTARHHISHDKITTLGHKPSSNITLVPGKCTPLSNDQNHFVIVDLMDIKVATGIFLYLWDAFDYMAANLDRVDRWSICFGRNGTIVYENFVQECIDRLHCYPIFQKHLKTVLPLLPFYKSGTIDKNFDVPVSRFIRHEYIAPETLEDAFKAAICYNTKQLVGGVLSIIQ